MIVSAYAKLNLSLGVHTRAGEALHGIVGMFQSIDWFDSVDISTADEDQLAGPDGSSVIDGTMNLAWRAVNAVRSHAGTSTAVRLLLDKRLPVAAGLGGGSADAAAALGGAGRIFDVGHEGLQDIAPTLGSDVPFCFVGGRAVVKGTGEEVSSLRPAAGYSVAIVVPPVELATAAVYAAWDRLDGPSGPEVNGRALPPSLRDDGPFVNDLYAAAVAVAPSIDDWRSELANRWRRPVMLTGSGPALFAYFVDGDEASSAIQDVPIGARAAEVAAPVDHGWQVRR